MSAPWVWDPASFKSQASWVGRNMVPWSNLHSCLLWILGVIKGPGICLKVYALCLQQRLRVFRDVERR